MSDQEMPRIPVRTRRATPRAGRKRFTLHLPNVPQSSAPARAFVCGHARSWGFSPGALSDIALAVGEAVSNSLEHGCQGSSSASCVFVSLSWDGKAMVVRVRDEGPGFDPEAVHTADSPLAERGRGLLLMSLLMDRVEHVRLPTGMEVRMEKRLRASYEDTIRRESSAAVDVPR